MDDFTELFSTMMNSACRDEALTKALQSFERDLSSQSENISALPPDPTKTMGPFAGDVNSFRDQPQDTWRQMMEQSLHPQYPIPTTLPCANVQPSRYSSCKEPGTMACSACKLVSYCSKKCQMDHWSRHKRDCKNPMRSTDWTANWIKELRSPSFIQDEPEPDVFRALQKEGFSMGMSLWGNMPAVDVINLASNENDVTRNLALAFIASGDLRNVLRSFNSLPLDYSGHLNIFLNDFNPFIFARNILLLLILGNVSDESMAADMALHFWYSVFMPSDYRLRLSVILTSFLQRARDNVSPAPLGPSSSLSTFFQKDFVTTYLLHFISSSHSIGDIQDEYDRVRTAPSRQDYRDRMYASLKPSHRVAFQQYRRFGIVLPFGAANSHFNSPNLSLFSPEGKWLQTDYADPLEGWDIQAVVVTGKSYGAHPEDIYGCFYFFLSKQLRAFASRLRKFSSSFTVVSVDARKLPQFIRENGIGNIPSSIKFDRIEVSNILDNNYVGLHDVLTLWGPLLGKTKSAAIIGYFMNWMRFQKSGQASGAGTRVIRSLTKKIWEKEKVGSFNPNFNSMKPQVNPRGVVTDFAGSQAILHSTLSDMEALYENSQPFSKFLQSQGLDKILRNTGLRLRDKHAVVPHRVLAPLEGPPTALPQFPDDSSWYYYTKLMCYTWSERYVEFESK